LQNNNPNIPAPNKMIASGSQTYNLPVIGPLAPGASVSFKMPAQKVNKDYYFEYNFIFLYLITNLGSLNMTFTREDSDRISFNSVPPTTDIIVQYLAPAGPTPTVMVAPTVAPKAPPAAQFPDGYTQILSGVPFYWPNSTISFKNISNNTITINTAQLQNNNPNIPAPTGMIASGSQTYNLPVLGTLAPGESTSFKMPSQKVNRDYGFEYNFSFMNLKADIGLENLLNINMMFTKEDGDRISFNSVPIKDILVQYHP
jgi:hypothetical protein